MEKDAREALQVTKEIVVKFIETGRISTANFAGVFPDIYRVVLAAINSQTPGATVLKAEDTAGQGAGSRSESGRADAS
ncbi:MAG: hypothetical protein LBN33_02035 [Desulfovibrio sp.]|jgi:hypothetical protein|nr:hypothetical protein [Desulfovibrio sp.]